MENTYICSRLIKQEKRTYKLSGREKKLSIKILLNKSCESQKGIYYLVVRVIYKRRKSEISLGRKIHHSNFCAAKEHVVYSETGNLKRKELGAINRMIDQERRNIEKAFLFLGHSQPGFGLEELINKYRQDCSNQYVETFTQEYIEKLRAEKKESTADAYQSGLNSLMRFSGDRKLTFHDITYAFINEYVHYLRKRGVSENTTGKYLSNFRALYNKARKRGLVPDKSSAFQDVKIHKLETVKRALSKQDVARIASVDLSCFPKFEKARDLFMFSFYSRGMSLVDIIYLKHSAITNGMLSYERNKTGQLLQVGMLPCLQAIVRKYRTDSSYVFPYLSSLSDRPLYKQYRYALGEINRYLKRLGKQLGIPIPLTTYVARHSWATIAKKEGFSIATISESLGHTSEETTKIYLQSFSNETIDLINEGVASAINDCIREFND